MASWSLIASVCSAALIVGGCRSRPELPVMGAVPPFSLTSQTGAAFNSGILDGKVWVADFIFTNCPGPCPRMTSQMKRVQKAYAGNSDLKLVSFTVDPARDTPPVLSAYATQFNADLTQWTFLTGDIPALHHLSRNVFMLGDVDGKTFDHSTRFMLVDRRGRIRGSYITAEADAITRLIADIKVLLEEKS